MPYITINVILLFIGILYAIYKTKQHVYSLQDLDDICIYVGMSKASAIEHKILPKAHELGLTVHCLGTIYLSRNNEVPYDFIRENKPRMTDYPVFSKLEER